MSEEASNILQAPATVYLQHGGDIDDTLDDVAWDQVTWCVDKINDSDIKYCRSDIHEDAVNAARFQADMIEQLEREKAELLEALEEWQRVWEKTECEYDDCKAASDKARAALAKAKGQQ